MRKSLLVVLLDSRSNWVERKRDRTFLHTLIDVYGSIFKNKFDFFYLYQCQCRINKRSSNGKISNGQSFISSCRAVHVPKISKSGYNIYICQNFRQWLANNRLADRCISFKRKLAVVRLPFFYWSCIPAVQGKALWFCGFEGAYTFLFSLDASVRNWTLIMAGNSNLLHTASLDDKPGC